MRFRSITSARLTNPPVETKPIAGQHVPSRTITGISLIPVPSNSMVGAVLSFDFLNSFD